jgi:hypothetical protein
MSVAEALPLIWCDVQMDARTVATAVDWNVWSGIEVRYMNRQVRPHIMMLVGFIGLRGFARSLIPNNPWSRR